MRVSQGFWGTREHRQNIEGNKGNISQFLGTGEQNSKNYSTKTFGKCVGKWEHREILKGNKGTRTPPPHPPWETLNNQLLTFLSAVQVSEL